MKKLLLLILCLSVPGWAWAETLYVRPASGEYGLEDGSSYANAFDDIEDIVWGGGAGQLGAGDTLILCGTFTTTGLQQKASGTAGSPITFDGDCSSQGDLSRAVINMTGNTDDYKALVNGWGQGPGATGVYYTYGTFKNMELIGYDISTTRIVDIGATNRATPAYTILDNLVIHDTLESTDICVRSIASNVTITNSEIYNCHDDGIYAEGNDNVFSYNNIHDVDTQSSPGGDCIQFGASVGVQNTGNWIHHNTLDHSSKASKQALIISCDTDLVCDNTVEFNTMSGGVYVLNYNPSGGTMRGNTLIAMSGTTRVLNVETQFGENGGANALAIYGNSVLGVATTDYGIFINPSTNTAFNVTVFNNTVSEFDTVGIRMFAGEAHNLTMKNNIVYTSVSSGTFAYSIGTFITVTNDYNNWYGAGTKWQGGGAADGSSNDLNVNPSFLSSTDLRLPSNSTLRRAGTTASVICIDVRGRPCYPDRPDIGAYQATSRDPANTRTAR